MRIGIYGGSFNPPHIAHLIVAEQARDQFALDKILWIPNSIPPHKTTEQFVDGAHRFEMTRLAVQSNPAFEVSKIELDREGISFTVDTVRALIEDAPDDDFFLIIGGDSLADFMTWHRPETIVQMVPLIVYRRPNLNDEMTEAEQAYPRRISFADAPSLDIASESIRQRIQSNRSIRYLVPEPVYDYIQQHRLYR